MLVSPNAKTFVAAYRKRNALKAEIDKLDLDLKYLSPIVLKEMEGNNIERLRVPEDNAEIVIGRKDSVQKKNDSTQDQVCEALRGCGFGDLVETSYSSQGLKKKLLTIRDAGQPIPPEIAQHVEITETKELEVRSTT